MAMPVVAVEIAFGDAWNVASPTWVAVTPYVRDSPPMRISRGRERVTRPRPGTLTVTLGNNDRRFDPDYASGPYAGDLKPMVPIRVTATHNAVTYPLFRGFVSEWRVSTTDGKDSTATVTAVDGLSVLELLRVGPTYVAEVATDSPLGWWKLDETSGTNANDSGSAGIDGTYVNTPTLNQAGPMTGMAAVSFDNASNERITVGSLTGSQCDESWTVEFWYKPTEQGDTALQVLVEVGTGYRLRYDWGTPTLTLVVPTGASTSYAYPLAYGLTAGTWYHVAWEFSLSDLAWRIYLDGVDILGLVRVAGFDNTVNAGAMTIAIGDTAGGAGSNIDGLLAQVAVFQPPLSIGRVAAHAAKIYNGFPSALTPVRTTAVLDLVGWPAADRTISTGLTTVVANTVANTALGAIWEAVDSEDSECFVSTAGKVVFTHRDSRGGSSVAATFSNDGSDTPYQGLTWGRDDSEVRTVIAVTDSAGDTLSVTDATNEAIYGPRTLSRTTYTTSATEPTDLAYWLLGEYKDALTQVELLLEAAAGTTTAIWAEVLSRELGDLVNVEVKPVGGTTQNDWDMFVEQIDLTCAVDLFSLRLGLSNAQGQGTFILDNAVFGQLDGPGRLGF